MEYIRSYFKTHVEYWWLYIVTIPIMSISFGLGLVLILYFGFTDKNMQTAEILARILFSMMSSLPLIIPNYKVSKEAAGGRNIGGCLYFVLNQSFSVVIYFIVYRIYFYLEYK